MWATPLQFWAAFGRHSYNSLTILLEHLLQYKKMLSRDFLSWLTTRASVCWLMQRTLDQLPMRSINLCPINFLGKYNAKILQLITHNSSIYAVALILKGKRFPFYTQKLYANWTIIYVGYFDQVPVALVANLTLKVRLQTIL